MLPNQSLDAFERFLATRKQHVAGLTVSDGIDAMLAFYGDIRADSCDIARDGDMLLFQYGTWDHGKGRCFEFDVTRQFIVGDGEDEDIWQLSLTYFFAPSPALQSLGSQNRWCHSPDDRDDLHSFILATPAWALAVATPILRVELDYDSAG